MSPLVCCWPCDGALCDLQLGHGGEMHSGIVDGQRRWFKRFTGEQVDFSGTGVTTDLFGRPDKP